MAKRNGLGELALIDGYSLGGDIGNYSYGGGPAALPVTGLNAVAPERIGGLKDGRMSTSHWFNPAVAQSFAVLSPLPSTDVDLMICHGQTLGQPAAFLRAKQANYDPNRGADGSLTFAMEAMANNAWLAIGELLTAGIRTESTATNGSSVDYGATSTLFGLTFMVQVTALGSGSPTIKLQDSADDSSFSDITGATAGVVAANGTYLVSTGATATVRRYVRAVTTGTFTGLSFVAAFQRHLVATI